MAVWGMISATVTGKTIKRIAEYEASVGVTAIAPATMTLPVEELEHILCVAAAYKNGVHSKKEADLVGVNMEGLLSAVSRRALRMRGISSHVIRRSVTVS